MLQTLQNLLPAEIFSYLLVFSRIGTTISLMPGFGESYVSPRIRLLLGLAITVLLTPIVQNKLPALPGSPITLALLVAGEAVIGLFMGSVARLLLSALATGGAILAFLSGLANAQLFNPLMSDQGALPGVFLSVMGLLLIFVTDTHHLMLMALLDGYTVFPPGGPLPLDDFANILAQLSGGQLPARDGNRVALPDVRARFLRRHGVACPDDGAAADFLRGAADPDHARPVYHAAHLPGRAFVVS